MITKLKEKLYIMERRYEDKLSREKEKYFNAEKKISELEYELITTKFNKQNVIF